MKRFFLFLALCIVFVQCRHSEIKLPIYNLTENSSIDMIADTILFTKIKCLTFQYNRLFFTNPVYDQIVSLDKNLRLDKLMGVQGRGPKNLLQISQFSIQDSLIYMLNSANGRINIYSIEGTFVSEVSLSNDLLFVPRMRHCFFDNHIIGSSGVANAPLSKYNIYTQEQTLFGEPYKFDSPMQTQIRNSRFTGKAGNRLVAVSDNQPYIEIYDQESLDLVVRYDFSHIAQVQKVIQYNESRNLPDNSMAVLTGDIYTTNQHLYTLFYERIDGEFFANQIIKFKISPEIKPVSIYKLPGEIYTTFCVSEEDNIVYAYCEDMNTIGAYQISRK